MDTIAYAFQQDFHKMFWMLFVMRKSCNYIDIPLQHIADNVLKSMKRGTTFEKTNSLLRDFREKVLE